MIREIKPIFLRQAAEIAKRGWVRQCASAPPTLFDCWFWRLTHWLLVFIINRGRGLNKNLTVLRCGKTLILSATYAWSRNCTLWIVVGIKQDKKRPKQLQRSSSYSLYAKQLIEQLHQLQTTVRRLNMKDHYIEWVNWWCN